MENISLPADFQLPANLDMNNHLDLPALVVFGIRHKAITTPGAQTLRSIARLIGRAQNDALPCNDLLHLLAGAIMHDHAEGFADQWHPLYVNIRNLAWAMCSSSRGLDNTLMRTLGTKVTLEDHLTVAKSFIDEETAKRALSAGDADKIIRKVMNELAPQYPELHLTFGYIGNIYWGPYQDDRSYRVFTQLLDRFGYSVHFGGHRTEKLGDLAFKVKAQLADWCAEQRAKLASGEVRSRAVAA